MLMYRIEIVIRNLKVYEGKKTYKAMQTANKQLRRGTVPFTVRPI